MSRGRTGKAPPSQGAPEAEAPRRHQAPRPPPLTTWSPMAPPRVVHS